jgi:hypothetical protein
MISEAGEGMGWHDSLQSFSGASAPSAAKKLLLNFAVGAAERNCQTKSIQLGSGERERAGRASRVHRCHYQKWFR